MGAQTLGGHGGEGRDKDFGRGKERTQTSGCTNRRSLVYTTKFAKKEAACFKSLIPAMKANAGTPTI